jgi:hypothetical protein
VCYTYAPDTGTKNDTNIQLWTNIQAAKGCSVSETPADKNVHQKYPASLAMDQPATNPGEGNTWVNSAGKHFLSRKHA